MLSCVIKVRWRGESLCFCSWLTAQQQKNNMYMVVAWCEPADIMVTTLVSSSLSRLYCILKTLFYIIFWRLISHFNLQELQLLICAGSSKASFEPEAVLFAKWHLESVPRQAETCDTCRLLRSIIYVRIWVHCLVSISVIDDSVVVFGVVLLLNFLTDITHRR